MLTQHTECTQLIFALETVKFVIIFIFLSALHHKTTEKNVVI